MEKEKNIIMMKQYLKENTKTEKSRIEKEGNITYMVTLFLRVNIYILKKMEKEKNIMEKIN